MSVRDAAEYIAALAAELASLAEQNGLELVAHFLDMAAVEAGSLVAEGVRG